MFSQAVSQTVGVESGSAGGCVSASFSVAGGVAGGTFEEGGAFCRGFSCEREGAGGLDMGEDALVLLFRLPRMPAGRP